jgi:hypothetical protein
MRLILVDRGKDFSGILRWQFRSHPEVQIVCGRFEDLPSFDCVVTAGNSFGLMDAGMDLADRGKFRRVEAVGPMPLNSTARTIRQNLLEFH